MKPSVPVLSLLLLLSSASVSAFAPLPGLNLRPRSFAHQPRSTVSWSRTLALQAEKAEKDAGQDDDEAPPLSEDWRNFRARLVSQEAPPYAVTAEMWNPDPETEDEAVFSGASNFIDPRKRKRSSRVRDGAGESWAHEVAPSHTFAMRDATCGADMVMLLQGTCGARLHPDRPARLLWKIAALLQPSCHLHRLLPPH
eukprot:2799016-Rhodomonas_salina.3